MEKVERILWRVVPGMKRFLILSKTLSFSCLLFPTYISMISWLLRIRSPLSRLLFPSLLSWALVNYVLATFACHSFTNPAILSRIFGSSETRRKISDLGFVSLDWSHLSLSLVCFWVMGDWNILVAGASYSDTGGVWVDVLFWSLYPTSFDAWELFGLVRCPCCFLFFQPVAEVF